MLLLRRSRPRAGPQTQHRPSKQPMRTPCRPASRRKRCVCLAAAKCPVLLLPGFLSGADQYTEARKTLERLGHPTRVVPLTVGDWLPTLAGANFTFYLERTLPVLQALHAQHGPVALVGHSAGGWIARILLGDALYDGKKWNNLDTVSSLLTLGAPHQSLEQYPFGRIKERRRNEDASLPDDVKGSSCRFVTHHYPNASDSAVPVVCCVGKTVKGVQGPLFDMQPGAAAYISYKANAADGATWGDGVCPMRTAIVPGAQLCVLEGVWHSPLGGRLWYGSAHAVQYWDRFLPASSPSS